MLRPLGYFGASLLVFIVGLGFFPELMKDIVAMSSMTRDNLMPTLVDGPRLGPAVYLITMMISSVWLMVMGVRHIINSDTSPKVIPWSSP